MSETYSEPGRAHSVHHLIVSTVAQDLPYVTSPMVWASMWAHPNPGEYVSMQVRRAMQEVQVWK